MIDIIVVIVLIIIIYFFLYNYTILVNSYPSHPL